MPIKVKVNVMVDEVKWKSAGYYSGKFHYQQVDPQSPIYVKKNGDVKANLVPDGDDQELEIEYNWLSTLVEIDDALYECHPVDPPEQSIWIVPGNAKPQWNQNPPVNGGDITAGGSGDKINLKDKNSPGQKYRYALALAVGIDGGKWLVDDPKILNKGINRFFALTGEAPPPPDSNGPEPTDMSSE